MLRLGSFALRVVGFLVAALVLASGSAAAKDLRVGTCQLDITPISPGLASAYTARFGVPAVVNHTDPIWLAGFSPGRSARDYHDRLWARGVVIDGDGGRVAIVALDLIGYFRNEVETIRTLVSPASAIDYAVVASTHQHQGPDTLGQWGPNALTTGIDTTYLDHVNATAARCIDEAAANLQRARVRFATTDTAGLSLGLDALDDGFGVSDGKVLAGDALLAPTTAGRIVDPRLAVMQFTTRGAPHAVIATLVNFGSHPESLGSRNQDITADFPHAVRERLEAEYGGLAIWLAGALGVLQGPLDIDVEDPATGSPAPRRSFRFAEVYGQKLADRAIAALSRAERGHPAPTIAFASTRVTIPLDNPFFRFGRAIGLNARVPLFTDGVPDPSVGFPFPSPFDTIPQALGAGLQTEVAALRIGKGGFVLLPTELDPQRGDAYRRLLRRVKHSFIVGLANDSIGYQVPFAKWDNGCHACAPYIIAGVPEMCPVQPIDCDTVFLNNVGRQVDPAITSALGRVIQALE